MSVDGDNGTLSGEESRRDGNVGFWPISLINPEIYYLGRCGGWWTRNKKDFSWCY